MRGRGARTGGHASARLGERLRPWPQPRGRRPGIPAGPDEPNVTMRWILVPGSRESQPFSDMNSRIPTQGLRDGHSGSGTDPLPRWSPRSHDASRPGASPPVVMPGPRAQRTEGADQARQQACDARPPRAADRIGHAAGQAAYRGPAPARSGPRASRRPSSPGPVRARRGVEFLVVPVLGVGRAPFARGEAGAVLRLRGPAAPGRRIERSAAQWPGRRAGPAAHGHPGTDQSGPG